MATYATIKEATFARAFLRYFGVGVTNTLLMTAIVAWMRAESGSTIIGNNPFNIRRSKFAIGYRRGPVGSFAVFKDLATAAKATAYFLQNNKGNGYDRIIAAIKYEAKAGAGKTLEQARATQGYDVLAAIALSKWSSTHYGIGLKPTLESYDYTKNRLVKVWYTVAGIPALPAEVKTVKAKAPKPQAPAPLDYHEIPYAFLDGGAAKAFYDARNKPLGPMMGGLDVTL